MDAHPIAALLGASLGLISSPDFFISWGCIYFALKEEPVFIRHILGISLGLVVHLVVMAMLRHFAF